MGKIRKKLAEMLLETVLFGAAAAGFLNIMASEPYIMLASPKDYIPNFTIRQYIGECPSLTGKTLAFLTYPGAKYGRYSHNKRLK